MIYAFNQHQNSLIFCNYYQISSKSTIKDVKEAIGLAKRKYADINRQELRLEPKGKFLKDEIILEDLGLNTGEQILPKFKRVSTDLSYIKKYYHKEIPTSGASCSSKAD